MNSLSTELPFYSIAFLLNSPFCYVFLAQDGRICEAVVWHLPQGTRHTVPDAIVRHVVQRHMPPGTTLVTHADALDSVLHSAELANEQVAAARQLLDAAFERLRKGLMAYVWAAACVQWALSLYD